MKTLKVQLNLFRVAPNAYSLSGGLPNEQYVLGEEANGQWEVYYSERGQKTGLKVYDSESNACNYFREKIKHDLCISD